eukprot:g14397.t1
MWASGELQQRSSFVYPVSLRLLRKIARVVAEGSSGINLAQAAEAKEPAGRDVSQLLEQVFPAATAEVNLAHVNNRSNKLAELLRPILGRNDNYARKCTCNGAVPVKFRLAVALRMFVGASYIDVALLFGVAKETVFRNMWEVVDVINNTPTHVDHRGGFDERLDRVESLRAFSHRCVFRLVYMLGDVAYPLRDKLLTPYPGKLLPQDQEAFNFFLNQVKPILAAEEDVDSSRDHHELTEQGTLPEEFQTTTRDNPMG